MAQKKKIKKASNFPKVKKELKDFMADDEGKMTRKDVAKLGVSLAILGMMMQPGSSDACCNSTSYGTPSHANTITNTGNAATHNNVTSMPVNHCNHCDGGWMC